MAVEELVIASEKKLLEIYVVKLEQAKSREEAEVAAYRAITHLTRMAKWIIQEIRNE
jgi:hypothetical protein